MNLPFTSITFDSDISWSFTWADTGATLYRVVLNGVFLDRVTTNSYISTIPGYETYPPPIEVVEDGSLALSEMHPPYIIIQWYGGTALAAFYDVREWNAVTSEWDSRAQIIPTPLKTVYTIQSPRLDDETTYLYEVVAVDSIDQESTGVEYAIDVVCPPKFDETSVLLDYAAGTLTISAAP